MTYEEFNKEVRDAYPTISNRCMRELYRLEYPEPITIADTPPLPVANINNHWVEQINQKEEGINPMITYDECTSCAPARVGFKAKAAVANAQIINAAPVEATQRDYAIELIKLIGEKHAQDLRVQFNMDMVYPQTFLELEALIKSGVYTVSDKAKDKDANLYNIFYGVHFGKPKDEAGYEAAKAVLKAEAQKAITGATLKPIDQLEAVIEDFEAWTL